jgi:hypothetical protein
MYQVVEKHSALLNGKDEEQIPVDANHLDICKFDHREDQTYGHVSSRIRNLMRHQKASTIGKAPAQEWTANLNKRSYPNSGPFRHTKRAKTAYRLCGDRNSRKSQSANADISDDLDGDEESDDIDGYDDDDDDDNDDDDSGESSSTDVSCGLQYDDKPDTDNDENTLEGHDGVALSSDSDEVSHPYCSDRKSQPR